MLRKSLFVFIIALFSFGNLLANSNDTLIRNEILSLLRKTQSDTIFYLNKLDYVDQALALAEQSDDKEAEMLCKAEYGVVYLSVNKYNISHQHFVEALFLAQELDIPEEEASINYLLGNLFGYLNNNQQALHHYNEFIRINEKVGDSLFYGFVLNSIGILHMKQENYDMGKEYFHKSINIFERKQSGYGLSYPTNNLGDSYLKMGLNDSALFYFEKALFYDSLYNNIKGIAIVKCNLGLVYTNREEYDKAIYNFNESLKIAQKYEYRKVAYDCYKDLSNMYDKKGNRDSALFYFHKYSSLKDTVLDLEITNQITNYQKFLEKKKQDLKETENRSKIALLNSEKSELRYKLSLYIIAFVLLLIISVMVYTKQRNDIKNKRQILIQKEELQKIKDERNAEIIEIQKNDRQKIEDELKQKKDDLLSFGLDIARKNTFNNEVTDKVKDLLNIPESDYKDTLVDLLYFLQNNEKIDKDLYLFQDNVEQINTEFFSRLLEKYPSLSKNEKNLCAMILLGLSIKDIAVVRNISPASIEVARYRLRKKLDLKKGDSLIEFLKTI